MRGERTVVRGSHLIGRHLVVVMHGLLTHVGAAGAGRRLVGKRIDRVRIGEGGGVR